MDSRECTRIIIYYTLSFQRRIIMNFMTFLTCGLSLYATLYFLLPKGSFKDYYSIYKALMEYIRIYRNFGQLMYFFVFYVWHIALLTFIRFFMNIIYFFYTIIQDATGCTLCISDDNDSSPKSKQPTKLNQTNLSVPPTSEIPSPPPPPPVEL
jgi:hypothetical protein